jgi:4-hydroxy-3-polyprenylbenzoate decarboxylase
MYNKTIEILKKHDLLKIIDEPLDINLEIPHIAYVEVKQEVSKALLFTNPIDKKNNKTFDTPVLMNVFCCPKAVELLLEMQIKLQMKLRVY